MVLIHRRCVLLSFLLVVPESIVKSCVGSCADVWLLRGISIAHWQTGCKTTICQNANRECNLADSIQHDVDVFVQNKSHHDHVWWTNDRNCLEDKLIRNNAAKRLWQSVASVCTRATSTSLHIIPQNARASTSRMQKCRKLNNAKLNNKQNGAGRQSWHTPYRAHRMTNVTIIFIEPLKKKLFFFSVYWMNGSFVWLLHRHVCCLCILFSVSVYMTAYMKVLCGTTDSVEWRSTICLPILLIFYVIRWGWTARREMRHAHKTHYQQIISKEVYFLHAAYTYMYDSYIPMLKTVFISVAHTFIHRSRTEHKKKIGQDKFGARSGARVSERDGEWWCCVAH